MNIIKSYYRLVAEDYAYQGIRFDKEVKLTSLLKNMYRIGFAKVPDFANNAAYI